MSGLAVGSRFDAKPGTVEWYVWQLIRAADSMRDHWADAEHDPARRQELWHGLHNAAELAATAMEEGPEAAEREAEAERRLKERLDADRRARERTGIVP